MGHLINPISLRLGYTQVWRSQWYKSTNREYISTLKEDFMLYNYIESFFKYAKLRKTRLNAVVKLTSKAQKKLKNKMRFLRPSQRKRIRVKRYVNSKIVEKLSLVFSHANILRTGSNLVINLHLYDGAFETFQTRQNSDDVFNFAQSEKISFYRMLSSHSHSKNDNLIRKNKNIELQKSNINISKFKSKAKVPPREFLRNFQNFYYVKNQNPINVLADFVKQAGYKYSPNIIKTDLFDLNRKQRIRRSLSNLHFRNNFPVFSTENAHKKPFYFKSSLNLNSRFMNTRLKYLFKSFKASFLQNSYFFKKNISYRKLKNKLNYYFNLVSLFAILHLTKNHKSKLQRIFVLRILFSTLLKLRIYISLYLKNFVKNSKRKLVFLSKNKKKLVSNRNKKNTRNIMNIRNIRNINVNRNLYNNNIYKSRKSRDSKTKKQVYNRIFKLKEKLASFKRNMIKLNRFILYTFCMTSQYSFEDNRLELYKLRYAIWFYISRVLFENIKTIINSKSYSQVSLSYFGLTNLTPTAAMLTCYLSTKLYQKYTIFELLRPLSNELSRNFTIDGFKISCAGRLTKKQRASLFIQKSKKVPANTFDSVIDYATGLVRLRHGVCGLKIWITRKKTYKFFDYNFNYVYNI